MKFTRRELLKCFAAGGMVIAGELWVPGAKKIFLPTEKPFPHGWKIVVEEMDEGLYSPQIVTMKFEIATEHIGSGDMENHWTIAPYQEKLIEIQQA